MRASQMHQVTLSFHRKMESSISIFGFDAGFQVYQTHWVNYPQMTDFFNLKWSQRMNHGIGIHAETRTFTGYFRDGDWPRILNLSIDRSSMARADDFAVDERVKRLPLLLPHTNAYGILLN